MDYLTVELAALGFQAVITVLLAVVYNGLWRHQRRPYFATWTLAWATYALKLCFIGVFVVTRTPVWLFAHQAATGVVALLLLLAALQFSRGTRWRRRYLWIGLGAVAWAFVAIYLIDSQMAAGVSAVILLSAVTLWTGWVFFQYRRRVPSGGALTLACAFTLWGLHHLDYPLLRPLGEGLLYGVFADVVFITTVAVGTLFVALSDGRAALEARRAQLEQLTRLLLRAQEDERRRVARDLHDEAGQVLTAVKMELDREGRVEASGLVAHALTQVRDLSNLLRPRVLDELGLVPALRGLVDDFAKRTHIAAAFEAEPALGALPADLEVALYRVVQEALTNVARHSEARHVEVRIERGNGAVTVSVQDDGRGLVGSPAPHLGLMGIRERVTELGGSLSVDGSSGSGFRLEASIPQ
jgi:signal transduction histidine kinase